jgi:2-methylisocitrate lyase-like PEP mutase family enzyme
VAPRQGIGPNTASGYYYHGAGVLKTITLALTRAITMSHPLHTQFKNLHTASIPLVIPNAWDAASAALFAGEGATAIATSSAALAWSLGYADGGTLPRSELLAAIARIQRVIHIPLTVDLEDGYSEAPQAVAGLVGEIAALGVAGINLEDGSQPPDLLANKIAASRRFLGKSPLFINARTDVYLRGLAKGDAASAMALERAKMYQAAGADGLFVPGMSSIDDTARIASQTPLPVNLMLLPSMPPIPNLFAAGARRFTSGPASFQTAYGHARRLAHALLANNDISALFANNVSYDAMNALLAKG